MLGRIFTVGGYTLLSRLTGFARDIILAAILGAGPLADAFFVALRLPNHFRAIFAEGAFNAAFVPAYAHVRGERGEASGRLFDDRIFTMLFFSQLVLLILACLFVPQAGVLEFLLLAGDAARSGILPKFAPLKLDDDVRAFFRALGPATVGSMGTQVALFADTIIATFLPAGALSALYYADRLNKLPIGVIGIAIGTVLLPEMSQRLTSGDRDGASASQRRAFNFTLLFSVPFVAAFLSVPEIITRAMFARGAFSKADAAAAGATLAAYAIGLIPFVLICSAVVTFYVCKDTDTPVKAALIGVAFNVALKIA